MVKWKLKLGVMTCDLIMFHYSPHSPWLQGANNFIGIIWETKRIHLVEQIYTKHRCFREEKRKLESVKTDLPKMVATIEYS